MKLQNICDKYDIQIIAWAPFAQGNLDIFHNETLCTIGKKYNKSNAQVILRWLYQNHIIAIPKSVHEDRIKQNYAIHDFSGITFEQ